MATSLEGKSGLAKAAIIFAVSLLVCLGLCGLNVVAMSAVGGKGGEFLVTTAFIESTGIVISLAGLVVTGVIAIIAAIVNHFKDPSV